jgi:hypothetical protein
LGGTFDVPLQSQATDVQTSLRLLPDVSLDLMLNKTGSIKATFFYKQSVDFLTGSTIGTGLIPKRYGTSISYGREFDNLGELFKINRKKTKINKQKDTIQNSSVDSTTVGVHY